MLKTTNTKDPGTQMNVKHFGLYGLILVFESRQNLGPTFLHLEISFELLTKFEVVSLQIAVWWKQKEQQQVLYVYSSLQAGGCFDPVNTVILLIFSP